MRALWIALGVLALMGLAAALPITPMAPDLRVVGVTSMAPVRPVAELLGATIDVAGERVTLARGGRTFTYVIGRTTAMANGKAVRMPEKAFVERDLSYLPLRNLVEALGGTLTADAAHQTVTATFPGGPTLTFRAFPWSRWEEEYDSAVDLHTVNLDGTGLSRLTYDCSTNDSPNFSPDGTRMVFARGGDLYLRALNSPNATLLWPSGDEADYADPRFTPDGHGVLYTKSEYNMEAEYEPPSFDTRSIYSSSSESEYDYYGARMSYQIFRINVDGTGKTQLADGKLSRISPDGARVAYVTGAGRKDPQVHLMNSDGTGHVLVGAGMRPRFSPDGHYLLYARPYERGDGNRAAVLTRYVLAGPDAGATRNVDPDTWDSPEEDAAFSADGARVVYTSGGLCTMKPDHTDVKELTIGDSAEQPVYTPDGAHIIYISSGVLMSIPAAGGEARVVLPKYRVYDFTLAPDGKSLVFSGDPTKEEEEYGWRARLAEGDATCTAEQAEAYLTEVMPMVEKAAGKPFTVRPTLKLVRRDEIRPLLAREMLPKMAALKQDQTRARQKRSAGMVAQMTTYGLLGKCGVEDNVLYVLSRNIRPLMKVGKIDEKHETAIMKLVIAHEATHVLQGQYLSLAKMFDNADTPETMMAVAAVTEGQASYVESQVADALGVQPAEKALAHAFTIGKLDDASPELGIVTNPFVRQLGDIYLGGQQFITWHITHDGPAKAWTILAAPPTRTSVIYRPETYGKVAADPVDYKAALAGMEKRFGDRKWRVENQEVGEMTLRTYYAKLDAATRDKIVGNITHAQNLVATAGTSGVTLTVFALADPAGAPLMLQTLEAMVKAQFDGMASSESVKLDPPVYADYTGPKIDAGRRITFTIHAYGETSTLQILRIFRGGMVVEMVTQDVKLDDDATAAIIDDLYARMLRKAVGGIGG